jgi:DNA repair protein RadD
LLGLTATPERSDGKAIGDIFDSIVVGATVRELTDLGHLVPCRVFAPPDTLETKHVALSPLDAYRKYAPGTRAVVFCMTVEHAERVADEMNTEGVRTAVVHGELSKQERKARLDALTAGTVHAIASIGVLTEGLGRADRRNVHPGA